MQATTIEIAGGIQVLEVDGAAAMRPDVEADLGKPRLAARRDLIEVDDHGDDALPAVAQHFTAARIGGVEPVVVDEVLVAGLVVQDLQRFAVLDRQARERRYPLLEAVIPVEAGSRFPISRDVWLEPFRTWHAAPSFGYALVREKRKLKDELRDLPGPELARLKREGVVIDRPERQAFFAVTGDTLPEVVTRQPHICEVETLILECTFLDGRKSLADARAGGHVHLDELRPLAGCFRNRTLVLSHFSQIYTPREVPALLRPLEEALNPGTALRCLSMVGATA